MDRRGSPHLPPPGVEWEEDDDAVPALRNNPHGGQGLVSSVERKRGHNGNGSGSSDVSNYTPMNKGNRHAGGGSSR